MTATAEETKTDEGQGGVGRIARVIGPVVDVEFPVDDMPEMYNKLEVELEFLGETKILSLEVALHIGDGMVRAISLQPTDGLSAARRCATPAARSRCLSATSPRATCSTPSVTASTSKRARSST